VKMIAHHAKAPVGHASACRRPSEARRLPLRGTTATAGSSVPHHDAQTVLTSCLVVNGDKMAGTMDTGKGKIEFIRTTRQCSVPPNRRHMVAAGLAFNIRPCSKYFTALRGRWDLPYVLPSHGADDSDKS
jgi:hypothetical protein